MTSTPYTPAPDVKARAVETLRAEAVERLATVARLRAELEDADAEVETQETAFFSSIAPLTARTADLKVQVTLAEQEAKALALELYRADPSSKKPVAGASIRIKSGVVYDHAKAFLWATAKGLFVTPPMLDQKALDKFLLTEPTVDDLPYTITETATVALDATLPTPEATA